MSAGGSSGGAAVAVAQRMLPLADGSDMGGSLRNPAGFCNVVGLRPTPGRVPTWPAPMAWSTLSVQGPMGRTVADVALQVAAIAGPDRRVPIALSDDPSGFAAPLPERLDGLRVAWAPDLGGRVTVDPAINRASMRRLAELQPALTLFGHGPPLRDPQALARVAE